jgi:hypothetical protein
LNNQDMVLRKRENTSSSIKSRHSSSDCSDIAKDGRHATRTAAKEDLSVPFDVHQQNEAFLPETDTSSSFGVEFVDSSRSGSGLKAMSHQEDDEDSTESDDGIVFTSHHSDGVRKCFIYRLVVKKHI